MRLALRHIRSFIIVCFVVVPLLGCKNPFEPDNATQFVPNAWYREMYDSAVKCIGKPPMVAFEEISWYTIPGFSFEAADEEAAGAAVPEKRRIYLADEWKNIDWVVQHEIAHIVLRTLHHPDDPFTRCKWRASQHNGDGKTSSLSDRSSGK
jgi:hypothetical protein